LRRAESTLSFNAANADGKHWRRAINMTSGPTSDTHLANTLHNNPDAYWCAHCWNWRRDCEHLVVPIDDAPRVMLNNWLLIYVAYDRKKRILEVCFNHGTRHQYRNVPRTVAVALVRAADPAKCWKENIERQYRPSAQVRGRHYTEREILMEMARALVLVSAG